MELKEINLEELTQINGGSELSVAIMYGIGAFFGAWYEAAKGEAIRPSEPAAHIPLKQFDLSKMPTN